MIAAEKAPNASSLEAAKVERCNAAAAVAEKDIVGAAVVATLKVNSSEVATLEERRAGAIVANKPDDVIAIDGLLLRARIAVEIQTGKATTITEERAAAVVALHDAERTVIVAAQAQFDAELIELAVKFTTAFNRAMEIGARLQVLCTRDVLHTPLNELSVALVLPSLVTEALERMPRVDERHVPLNILRNGDAGADVRARRLAELVA